MATQGSCHTACWRRRSVRSWTSRSWSSPLRSMIWALTREVTIWGGLLISACPPWATTRLLIVIKVTRMLEAASSLWLISIQVAPRSFVRVNLSRGKSTLSKMDSNRLRKKEVQRLTASQFRGIRLKWWQSQSKTVKLTYLSLKPTRIMSESLAWVSYHRPRIARHCLRTNLSSVAANCRPWRSTRVGNHQL